MTDASSISICKVWWSIFVQHICDLLPISTTTERQFRSVGLFFISRRWAFLSHRIVSELVTNNHPWMDRIALVHICHMFCFAFATVLLPSDTPTNSANNCRRGSELVQLSELYLAFIHTARWERSPRVLSGDHTNKDALWKKNWQCFLLSTYSILYIQQVEICNDATRIENSWVVNLLDVTKPSIYSFCTPSTWFFWLSWRENMFQQENHCGELWSFEYYGNRNACLHNVLRVNWKAKTVFTFPCDLLAGYTIRLITDEVWAEEHTVNLSQILTTLHSSVRKGRYGHNLRLVPGHHVSRLGISTR